MTAVLTTTSTVRKTALGQPAADTPDDRQPRPSIRVLHVLDHGLPTQDGYVYRTHGLLSGQRAHGLETFHLTSPRHEAPTEGPEEVIDGWHFFRTGKPTVLRLPLFRELMEMRATARRIDDIGQTVRPDIIHAHSPVLNGYPALLSARKLGIPVVYEIRAFWEDAAVDQGLARQDGPRYRATRALETALCRRVDAVTTICRGLRDNLIDRGIDSPKISVIPNAVDAGRFANIAAPQPDLVRRLGLEGCTVLGFIGSFYAYEGLMLMVEAMPALLESHPDLRLLLIGGGHEEPALKSLVETRGLGKQVILAGRVPHDQVTNYYRLIDICVYPRLPMPLTDLVTPLKPLEAMAAGRIVVASDVGGHGEMIDHKKTGFLFEAGNVESLIACLRQVLASRACWGQVRANGRVAVANRGWHAVTAVYGSLFERLCRTRMAA